jgi:predicted metal-dependent enzyme (double-stranded beta helix superfamily)
MSNYSLDNFINECREVMSPDADPIDRVELLVPSMYRLLNGDTGFLKPEHFTSDPEHYARNAIHIEDDNTFSLYALVWSPGQWTPIHDHGTWGVVGVYEGALHEQSYFRTDCAGDLAKNGIVLARGGVIILAPGAVTSFVPNPDHIHLTGNPDPQNRIVSLHLYGSAMAGFNIYDRPAQTRKWVEVSHNES